jgi:hypothetical protein
MNTDYFMAQGQVLGDQRAAGERRMDWRNQVFSASRTQNFTRLMANPGLKDVELCNLPKLAETFEGWQNFFLPIRLKGKINRSA